MTKFSCIIKCQCLNVFHHPPMHCARLIEIDLFVHEYLSYWSILGDQKKHKQNTQDAWQCKSTHSPRLIWSGSIDPDSTWEYLKVLDKTKSIRTCLGRSVYYIQFWERIQSFCGVLNKSGMLVFYISIFSSMSVHGRHQQNCIELFQLNHLRFFSWVKCILREAGL